MTDRFINTKEVLRLETLLRKRGDVLLRCYDLNKVEFFRENNVDNLGFSVNKNTGNIYYVFSKNNTEKVYNKWLERSKNMDSMKKINNK